MSTACKECGESIVWRRDGKNLQCFNADDGSVHWDRCSKNRWRQTVKTGERFDGVKIANGIASGYANSVHGTKFLHIKADFVTKSKKKIVDCAQCVPPWEVCPNKCPNAIKRAA